MPTSTVRYLRGLAAGLAFLVVPLLVAWAASADTSLVGQMMPYGFMVTVAWWLAVIAGTAVAVGNTHRMTAGVIVGVVSVVLLQGSIALLQAPEMRVETFTSLRVW